MSKIANLLNWDARVLAVPRVEREGVIHHGNPCL
jgi:hypothetical protein